MPGKQPVLNKTELDTLLASTAKGDPQAFARIVEAFWKNVYLHALTYTRSSQLAEEATQDIFIKIWNSRDKLPALDSFENFLFIVARNLIISAMRKRPLYTTGDLPDELVERAWQPDQQLRYKEFHERLLKGIDRMPPQRKLVFTLSRLDGMSHEEIGNQLGISKNTVKEHIIKGLNFLKLYMHGDLENMLLLLTMLSASLTGLKF